MTQILTAARPFLAAASVLFALVAAVKGLTILIPALGGIVAIRGGLTEMCALAIACALAGK
jgi:hypothetical protein